MPERLQRVGVDAAQRVHYKEHGADAEGAIACMMFSKLARYGILQGPGFEVSPRHRSCAAC